MKEEALSAWETLQAMEEVALKSFPRYVTGGFFRDGGAPNIRTTMTFLRRVARYVGRVVALSLSTIVGVAWGTAWSRDSDSERVTKGDII